MSDYSYCYEQLISWLIEQLNTQKNEGALHNLTKLIGEAGYPKRMLISLGSSRYTKYGEEHQLQSGDELCAVLYDSTRIDNPEIHSLIVEQTFDELLQQHIVLKQSVYARAE